jgi:hypothetical protein
VAKGVILAVMLEAECQGETVVGALAVAAFLGVGVAKALVTAEQAVVGQL